jgi:hypothetical protein
MLSSTTPPHIHLTKDMLGSSGEVTVVEPPFMCDYGVNIHVGENFYANFNCCILDGADVIIGDDVMFGPAVHVYTAHHPIESGLRYSGKELCHPVSIGNRVWVRPKDIYSTVPRCNACVLSVGVTVPYLTRSCFPPLPIVIRSADVRSSTRAWSSETTWSLARVQSSPKTCRAE